MDTEARQILHDEQTNECRNIHPSSQSRKISIGVMADSKARTRCGDMKGDGAVVPNTERVISNVGNINGEKNKDEGVTASFNVKQIGGPEAMRCSWISKSFHQRTPTSEAILQVNKASTLLVSPGGRDEPDGIECAAEKHSVQFFSYQSLNFPSNNYKKFDGDTSRSCRRKGREDGTTEERAEEFTFTTAPEVIESDKTKAEDKINRTENRTENLRMKLCQILGATSSPKTQRSGSHSRNVDEESSPLEQSLNQKENKFVKPIQNSDTIETDSEKADHAHIRPVTRSLSRKRAFSQKQPGKGKSGPSSKDPEKHPEKNIFSFEEKWIEDRNAFPNDGPSMSMKKKKSQGKSSRIGRRKICFNENHSADKLHQDTLKTDLPLHDGAPFSLGNKMGGFIGCLPDYQTKSPQTQKINQEKEFYQPPTVNNTDQNGELEVSENGDQREYISDPVKENGAKSQDNFQSPTFQLRTPILSSPSSTPKTDKKANDVSSSPASSERRFSLGTIRNLRTFQALEPDSNGLRKQKQSSGKEKLKHSIPKKDKSFENEEKEQDGSSDSSSEERNFQRSHQGTEEGDWIASEQNQDGFVRAVELFALELGKLKSKLKSMTSQKSSEILKSVAEHIHLQLQDVHSQIQTDIGKLTNLSKSKRKRLETRFEGDLSPFVSFLTFSSSNKIVEQQKELRLIYDRFKEEVNLHLQDCRSTVEDLEADQIEIKGALEKQRVAHKKLLSQVEEAVEIQLNDAQRKITATQEANGEGKTAPTEARYNYVLERGTGDWLYHFRCVVLHRPRLLSPAGSLSSINFKGLTFWQRFPGARKENGQINVQGGSLSGVTPKTHSYSINPSQANYEDACIAKSARLNTGGSGPHHSVITRNSYLCTSSTQHCLCSPPLKKPRIMDSSQTPATNSQNKQDLGKVHFSNTLTPNCVSFVSRSQETPPDEQSEAVGHYDNQTSSSAGLKAKRKVDTNYCDEQSSSLCSLAASNNIDTCSSKHDDNDDSTYLSDNDEEPDEKLAQEGTRVKRRRNANSHSLYERKRRNKINKKMRMLKELIPNCNKMDKASMLDDAIEYLKTLQLQLQIMSMGAGLFMPFMMLPTATHPMINTPQLPQLMGFRPGTGISFSLPQFPIAPFTDNRVRMFGLPNQVPSMPISHAPFIPMVGNPSTQPLLAENQASSQLTTIMSSVPNNSYLNGKAQTQQSKH
ncbi:Myc-type, basic helix-loop-helix [Sesbania bispinosa]|nr:Myc-type, basic helix-loop-helix [Sesbania bispinosa]